MAFLWKKTRVIIVILIAPVRPPHTHNWSAVYTQGVICTDADGEEICGEVFSHYKCSCGDTK